MKIAFLVKDLQLSGGVNVVVHHARQLRSAHGHDVTLVRTGTEDLPDWPYEGLDELRVAPLEEVAGERFDVAVATWWETAMSLFELDARRHAYFVQLLEDSHYPQDSPERHAFALTLTLPVHFITEARWIAEVLEGVQPGATVHYARNGIHKEVFVSPPEVERPDDGPLRVLIEGNPELVRKGVPHALAAVRRMREPRHVTFVSGAPVEQAPPGVDEVLAGLSAAEMAAVFGRSHVLVKLSRAEGMYGPPLEGFHLGCTVVTTPVTGHDEYVEHLVNGLVVDWDDPPGTAAALDLLATDRELLHRLRTGALATAAQWPSWEEASAVFEQALQAIADGPPVDPVVAGRRAAADLATTLNVMDSLAIEKRGYEEGLKQLRRQKAVRAAFAARAMLTPVRNKARGARNRLTRGST